MKMLIVDNDQDTVITLQALLNGQNNLSIDVATSAKEAFAMMHNGSEPYQVVMLDIMMPEESGIDFAERISEDSSLNNSHVIIMSSALPLPPDEFLTSLHKDNRMSAVKGVLEKPFTSDALMAKINEALKAS